MKIVTLLQNVCLRLFVSIYDLVRHGKRSTMAPVALCREYITNQPEERIAALNLLNDLATTPPSVENWVKAFNYVLKISNTIGLEYPDTAKQPFKLFTMLELRNDKIRQEWQYVQDIRYEYLTDSN